MSATALRLRVAPDGSGDYRTIGEALASLSAGGMTEGEAAPAVLVSIAAGFYREKIRVMRPHVTFAGEGPDATIISWDDHAPRALPSGEPMGTFNTATLYIGAEDFCARALRIENSAGDGRVVGQAVACYVDADRAAFIDCVIAARQDTLCLGPLPNNPLPKGLNPIHPVRIAREGDGARPFRHNFQGCRIEGDIDFIFGSSTALFEACDIVSLDRGESVNGYIAAPSTLPGQKFGFVFLGCRLAGDMAPGSAYLGRPWRRTAKAAFVNCFMGPHIAPEGWDNWGKPENEGSAEFVECGSQGPGAPEGGPPSRKRLPWARILSAEESARFRSEAVLSGSDGWNPLESED